MTGPSAQSTEQKPRLTGIAYELGEEARDYREIVGRAEAMTRYGMADDAALWGFGQYRRTNRDTTQLAVAAARKTLDQAQIAPQDIDTVILCSTSFPNGVGSDTHLDCCNSVFGELELFGKLAFGMTLNRCGTMLTAIHLAARLVAAQCYRNVLIVSSDVVANEAERFQNYAVLSDAASSCLVTAADRPGYDIIHTSHLSAPAATNDTGARLAATVNKNIRDALDIDLTAIRRVFHDNLFIPLVSMREQAAGFNKRQLYLKNIAAIGHCFSSDPLISLADCMKPEEINSEDYVGLFSSTPGLRVGIILASGRPASAMPNHAGLVNPRSDD